MGSLQEDQPTLRVGDMAPDFTLPSHNEGELNLAWYRTRKNVVLAFYPADWTPVCATQIPGYKPLQETLEKYNTQLLGISVDSVFCHTAWAKSLGGLFFPLMSDYFPHGEVARKYGVLHPKGFANRTVFLIDTAGVIRYVERMNPAGLPNNDALVAALKTLAGDSL
jgi:peroxiredoxin